MGNITFSEIMDFYPGHNKSVYEDLKKDYQRGGLIPFVGAGLSVFCGYLGWSKVLERLAVFVYDEDTKAKILKMIDDGELLLAAQKIYNHYPRMSKELQKIIDYNKIKSCDLSVLYASAAYVLPYLFSNSTVMTTNFDRVLEEVYDRCHAKFEKIVSPYELDILAQVRQSSPHCLFKLHGDIGPEIHDIGKLVFTQTQYDTAYDSDGQLMQELSQWFQNKRLLFLGCSLMQDRTMEVLQQVMTKNPGLDHYAILACSPEDIGKRSRELGDLGISPIFYPMGKHDAVRVILERLLEESDHSAYEELRSRVDKHMTESKADHRFMYDSGYIEFTGREQELEQLQDFCQDPRQIAWWAVTGPGGMGKSRLVHEFTKARKEEGWEIVWLNQGVYTKLLGWRPPVDRCILVADDVQSYLQTVGEWIASDSIRQRSEKLRILLLEREGEDMNSAKWAEMMQSDSPYDDTIQSLCYRSDFLQLEPLSEEELKTIMVDFSLAYGKPLKDSEAERLLSTLQKVDGGLQRPIYALAIVDAWCDGKDPTRWDKGRILNELTDRELRFYYERLRNLSSDRISKELRSEFENLLARSCLEQFLPLDDIGDKEYQKLRNRAGKLEMDFVELLRAMGVVHQVTVYVVEVYEDETGTRRRKKQENLIEAVVLDCPDLVKEYLVLRQAFDKGQMELLLPDHWENNPNQLRFFSRILVDYPEKLEGQDRLWEGFFAGDPETDFLAWVYSDLLFGITVLFPKLEEQALGRLKKLYDQFQSNEKIALSYAKGLVNLTVEQPQEKCRQNIGKLKELHEQYESSEEIAVEYARGLFILTYRQPQEECEQSVAKLRELHEQYESNEQIAVEYANGLFNLMVEQPQEECGQSVEKLRELHECYEHNEEIAVEYAKSLFNLTVGQSKEECEQSIAKLRELHEQYENNEEMAVQYAKGLFNLTFDQTQEKHEQIVTKLKALHEQYEENKEIVVQYANALLNLMIKQPLVESKQSIDKLRRLHERYEGNEKVLADYAGGLYALIIKQPLEESKQSINELKNLYEHFQDNKEMVTLYMDSLVNFSFAQNTEEEVRKTIQESKKVLNQYPDNTKMQLSYAQTWFNLTLVQSMEALQQTVLELREYLMQHPDVNKEFQLALDQYLEEHPDHTERYSLLRLSV